MMKPQANINIESRGGGGQNRATLFDNLLTVNELADYLKCSESFIYQQVANGRMKHLRVGRHLRFDIREIRAWLKGDGEVTHAKKKKRKVSRTNPGQDDRAENCPHF